MDLTELVGMDPVGQLRADLHSAGNVMENVEMLCTVLMAMPEVAEGMDAVSLCNLLRDAIKIHPNNGDVHLMCMRCCGIVLEFVPKATQRVGVETELAGTVVANLKQVHGVQLEFLRSTKDEWLEESLKVLGRFVLEGADALASVPGGYDGVADASLAALDSCVSPYAQAAVLKLLATMANRTHLPSSVVVRVMTMIEGSVAVLGTLTTVTSINLVGIRNTCECLLSMLDNVANSLNEFATIEMVQSFIKAVIDGIAQLTLFGTFECSTHVNLLLYVLASFTHAAPVKAVPVVRTALIGADGETIVACLQEASGAAGVDFTGALSKPLVFLTLKQTEGDIVTQESFQPCPALSSLLHLMAAVFDVNTKTASMSHRIVPLCRWYWEDDANNFHRYDETSCLALEHALRTIQSGGTPPKKLTVAGKYHADIATMKQQGGAQSRNIQRNPVAYAFHYDANAPPRLTRDVPVDIKALARLREIYLPIFISISESGDALHAPWALDLVEKAVNSSTTVMAPSTVRSLCTFLSHKQSIDDRLVARIVGRLQAAKGNVKSAYTTVLSKLGLVPTASPTVDDAVQKLSRLITSVKKGALTSEVTTKLKAIVPSLTGTDLLTVDVSEGLMFLLTLDGFKEYVNSSNVGDLGIDLLNMVHEALLFIVDDINANTKTASWTSTDSASTLFSLLTTNVVVSLCESAAQTTKKTTGKKADPKCPKGHPLADHVSSSWRCDVCSASASDFADRKSHACRECDYDMCSSCWGQTKGAKNMNMLTSIEDIALAFNIEETHQVCLDGVGPVPRAMNVLQALVWSRWRDGDPVSSLHQMLQKNVSVPAAKKAPKKSAGKIPTPAPDASITQGKNIFRLNAIIHVVNASDGSCPCGGHTARPITLMDEPTLVDADLFKKYDLVLKHLATIAHQLQAVFGIDTVCEIFSQKVLQNALQRVVPIALLGRFGLPVWFAALPEELVRCVLSESNRASLVKYLIGGALRSVLQYFLTHNKLTTSNGVVQRREVLLAKSNTGSRSVKTYVVQRDHILSDGLNVLKTHSGLGYTLEVNFTDEVGTGQGPTSEFVSLLSSEFLDPSLGLWHGIDATNTNIENEGVFPVKQCTTRDVATSNYYDYFGQLIGVSLVEGKFIEVPMNPMLVERLQRPYNCDPEKLDVMIRDVSLVDVELGTSLQWLHEALTQPDAETLISSLCLTFTCGGHNLIPHGSDVPVTATNAAEYLQKAVQHILVGSVARNVEKILQGLATAVSLDFTVLRYLTREELLRVLCGTTPDIPVEDFSQWLEPTGGYTEQSDEIDRLVRVWSRDFNKEDRSSFVFFCTGVKRMGPGGVRGMKKLTVRPWAGSACSKSVSALPTARACGFILNLPAYSSDSELAEKLRYAMQNSGGFHLS